MDVTRELITEKINDPFALEELYCYDGKAFTKIIREMREQEPDPNQILEYWHTRLFYKPHQKDDAEKKRDAKKYVFTFVLIILTWIPVQRIYESMLDGGVFVSFDENIYSFMRIMAIFSAAMSVYCLLVGRARLKNAALCLLPSAALFAYTYVLPRELDSQPLFNAFLFSFALTWFFVLFAYSGCNVKKLNYAGFIEKTGETALWTLIVLLGSVVIILLMGILFASFMERAADVSDFLDNQILSLCLVAAPFVALLILYSLRRHKRWIALVNGLLPFILLAIIIFALVTIFTDAKPYGNKDVFIACNWMMVIAVCVMTFTDINGINNDFVKNCGSYLLPVVAAILGIYTLSAVIYRLSEYGVTANNITLLGTNVVMLCHLSYMSYLKIRRRMARNTAYLPVYFAWAFCVVFILPFIFDAAAKMKESRLLDE